MPTQKEFDRLHRQWAYDTAAAERQREHASWWTAKAGRYLARCSGNPLARPIFSLGASSNKRANQAMIARLANRPAAPAANTRRPWTARLVDALRRLTELAPPADRTGRPSIFRP